MGTLLNYLQARYKSNPREFLASLQRSYYKYGAVANSSGGVNILGIRSKDKDSAVYNDVIIVFTNTVDSIKICEATTDPGQSYLLKPINSKGTAILTEGYHKDIWAIGYHKNRKDHKALIQVNRCTVYRDNNKDKFLDFNGAIDKGLFGINCHRASKSKISNYIGLNSAGCQVFKDANDLEYLVSLAERDNKEGRKYFSYLLINEL